MKQQDTLREASNAREEVRAEAHWHAVCQAYEARVSQLVVERDAAVEAASASLRMVAELQVRQEAHEFSVETLARMEARIAGLEAERQDRCGGHNW